MMKSLLVSVLLLTIACGHEGNRQSSKASSATTSSSTVSSQKTQFGTPDCSQEKNRGNKGQVFFAAIPRIDSSINPNPWNDRNLFLWGANNGNYNSQPGTLIGGSGMAGTTGPTKGIAHEKYIGILTMQESGDEAINQKQFSALKECLKKGHNIFFPILHDKWSLGTGIALMGGPTPQWNNMQKTILTATLDLIKESNKEPVIINGGKNYFTFPDPNTNIKDSNDLKNLINQL